MAGWRNETLKNGLHWTVSCPEEVLTAGWAHQQAAPEFPDGDFKIAAGTKVGMSQERRKSW